MPCSSITALIPKIALSCWIKVKQEVAVSVSSFVSGGKDLSYDHMQSAVRRLADLGCGTFGNVWLGHNSTFGKVAVKTVKVRPLPHPGVLNLC